jgi:hypothetical protein
MKHHGVELSALIVFAVWGSPVCADLGNCADLAGFPERYKLALDDIVYAPQSAIPPPEQSALMNRLTFSLHGTLEDLNQAAARLESLSIPLQVVTCSGRRPSMTGQEFTAAEAEQLNDNRVVVEMWGIVEKRTGGGAPAGTQATLLYTIPPVQRYFPDGPPASLVKLVYPKPHSGLTTEQALDRLSEVPAFVLIGLGTKAARAHQYDAAVWAFTQSQTYIREAQVGAKSAELDQLLAYVRLEACRTRLQAKADTQNYKGALRAVPAGDCTPAPPQ